MKVVIELDTDLPSYCAQISVDGKRVGFVQELDLHVSMEDGSLRLTRKTLGYGGRYTNLSRTILKSEGGPWKQV